MSEAKLKYVHSNQIKYMKIFFLKYIVQLYFYIKA